MAVGRGSMERAAKAAGTDTSARKSTDKAQTPYRRMTISEIVGETSTVEPPRAGRMPAGKPTTGSATANKATAGRTPAVEKPAVKSEPVPAVEEPAEKRKVVAVEESKVKAETPVMEEAAAQSEVKAAEKPVAENVTAEDIKPNKETVDVLAVQETDLAEEISGRIVYQKSSGMLERAAEPNERFGLGDAMPIYYF